MKLDILAIGAHPDDVELSCAGTLLAQIVRGSKVGLLDLTQGELGTRGTGRSACRRPLTQRACWVYQSAKMRALRMASFRMTGSISYR